MIKEGSKMFVLMRSGVLKDRMKRLFFGRVTFGNDC